MKALAIIMTLLSISQAFAKECSATALYDVFEDKVNLYLSDSAEGTDEFTALILGDQLKGKSCREIANSNLLTTASVGDKEVPLVVIYITKSGQHFKNLPTISDNFSAIITPFGKNKEAQLASLKTDCSRKKLEAEKYVQEVLKGTIVSSKGCEVDYQDPSEYFQGGYSPSDEAKTSYEIIFR